MFNCHGIEPWCGADAQTFRKVQKCNKNEGMSSEFFVRAGNLLYTDKQLLELCVKTSKAQGKYEYVDKTS